MGSPWKVLAPWAMSGLAVAYALVVGGTPPKPSVAPSAEGQPDQVSALLRELRSLEGENTALRQELDRLRLRRENRGAGSEERSPEVITPETGDEVQREPSSAEEAAEEPVGEPAVAAAPPEPETCDRIAERAAEESEIELAQAPAEEESAADDGGVADYRSNAIALIAARLQDQPDPALRGQLVTAASQLALPDTAPLFAPGFIQALQNGSDPAARAAAARGLRFAHGADVDEALAGAAYDRDEHARRAAVDSLAAHPESRGTVEDLIRSEESPAVRSAAECRLQLQEAGSG